MTKQDVFDLVNASASIYPDEKHLRSMVAEICSLTAPADASETDILAGAAAMRVDCCPSEPGGDQINYYLCSPFDGKRYNFVASWMSNAAPSGPYECG